MNYRIDQKGFTLLEALIAMLITGGALLGLAMVQLKSMQQSQFTAQRSLANIQANDLIDRIWANRCAISTQETNVITRWRNNWNGTNNSSLLASQQSINGMMPNWQGDLTHVATSSDNQKINYQLVITWTNTKANAYPGSTDTVGQQNMQYNFSVPKCIST